ncbi:hypothetical protein FB451DRAFT_1405872 [Mycena latifolia]|nr:hypothetical protein FB451DRAFT_1405872 [Mycena latifolia]
MTDLLVGSSIGRLPRDGLTDEEDWRYYYVNFFVDRDMYMRYLGGGVGHYQVNIPEEDEAPVTALDDEDVDSEPEPALTVQQAPLRTPPGTPEPSGVDLPDRPGSSLSQNSEESAKSSDSEEGDSDGEEGPEEDALGPEDGDGYMEDEVEEGYTPL